MFDWNRPLRLQDHPHIKVVKSYLDYDDSSMRVVSFSSAPNGTRSSDYLFNVDGTRPYRLESDWPIGPLEYDDDLYKAQGFLWLLGTLADGSTDRFSIPLETPFLLVKHKIAEYVTLEVLSVEYLYK